MRSPTGGRRRILLAAIAVCQLLQGASGMRLLLIRHAQSQNNVAAREVRQKAAREGTDPAEARLAFEAKRVSDPSLSELGELQAESLADFLAADTLLDLSGPTTDAVRLFCSPMRRTMLTAQPILRAFPHWICGVDERLFEVGGLFALGADGKDESTEGTAVTAIEAEFGADFTLSEMLRSRRDRGWYTLGQRETREQALERARRVASWVHEESKLGHTSLMVLVIHGDLLSMLLRELLGSGSRFLHYNTASTCVELNGAGCTMIFQNRAEHLVGESRTGDEMLMVVS